MAMDVIELAFKFREVLVQLHGLIGWDVFALSQNMVKQAPATLGYKDGEKLLVVYLFLVEAGEVMLAKCPSFGEYQYAPRYDKYTRNPTVDEMTPS